MASELIGRRSIDTPAGRVTVTRGRARENAVSLSINGVCQSFIDLDDPSYMHMRFQSAMANAVDDLLFGLHSPKVLHVGGGALAQPRRINHMHPGSTHVVFEPNFQMVNLVFDVAPLAEGSNIELRFDYGEVGIKALDDEAFDLIILDAYVGMKIPEGIRTNSFFMDTARVLAPGASMVVNVIDEPGLPVSNELIELGYGRFDFMRRIASARMRSERGARGNILLVCTKSD